MRVNRYKIKGGILLILLVVGFFALARSPPLEAQCSLNLLILGDGTAEYEITPFLPSNINWTVAPVTEGQWDGTNPPLTGFDVVLLLDGNTWDVDMPVSGQTALVNFVTNGGGFIGTAWLPWEVANHNAYSYMRDLIPQTQVNDYITTDTYTVIINHPVTQGLPSSFFVPYACVNGSSANSGTVVITGTVGQDAVVVKDYGAGKVVGLVTCGGVYCEGNPWNSNMQTLLINAIEWAGECGPVVAVHHRATMNYSPLANTNISKAETLLTEAGDLLSQANAKNLDTSSCEALIEEARQLLQEAQTRKTSPQTANYFALKAAEKVNQAIDCLKALIG